MEQIYQTSTLNAFIPSGLQLHLPRIPSFRRSISGLSLPSITRTTDVSLNSGLKPRGRPKFPESSELIYKSTPLNDFIDPDEIDRCYYEVQKFNGDKLLNSQNSHSSKVAEGGIIWKFALHGCNLLKLALSESASPSLTNAPFARQLYIHSLTYLIRALPPDLTIDERVSIQAALPGRITETLEQHPPKYAAEVRPTSFLHRTLASTIVQLFLLFQLILPYLRLLLEMAWSYQNEHQIIAKMTSFCVDLGVGVGEALKGLGETKMGDLLIVTVKWLIEGIVGGVGEGVVMAVEKKCKRASIHIS